MRRSCRAMLIANMRWCSPKDGRYSWQSGESIRTRWHWHRASRVTPPAEHPVGGAEPNFQSRCQCPHIRDMPFQTKSSLPLHNQQGRAQSLRLVAEACTGPNAKRHVKRRELSRHIGALDKCLSTSHGQRIMSRQLRKNGS